eukprot:3949482-Amphidinium_carterae.1
MLADRLGFKTGGVEGSGLPRTLVKLTIGSIVVLIAATYDKHWDYDEWGTWAFICSIVSTIICVFLCIVYGIGKENLVAKAMPFVAVFLLCWWIAGTGLMTFEAPFVHTGNGYFGAWLALISAAILCYDTFAKFRELIGKIGEQGHLVVLLLICSITLLIQVIEDELDDKSHHDNLIVGWIVACATLVMCIIMMFLGAKPDFLKVLMVLMLVAWSIGVGVLTFDGPYKYTGNAYFACWGGFILSVLGVWALFPQLAEKAGMPAAPKTMPAPVAQVVGAVAH